MWRVYYTQMQQDPRFGPFITWVQAGRSGWVLATAVMVGLMVVVIPLVLLALAGLFVGVMTFVVLSLLVRAYEALQSLFSGRGSYPSADGRRNVRVIDEL